MGKAENTFTTKGTINRLRILGEHQDLRPAVAPLRMFREGAQRWNAGWGMRQSLNTGGW